MSKTKKIGLLVTSGLAVMITLKLIGVVNYNWLVATSLLWGTFLIWLLWLIGLLILWGYWFAKNWWL